MTLAAERHRVDGLLVAAIVEAESGFVPTRVSPRGAVGLMQVLPSTAGEYGDAKDLLDPRTNLDVGSRYLGRLIEDFDGDVELAVAAYNAGPGAVERYGGVPPYAETKDYVKRVLTLYDAHHQTAGAGRDPFSPLSERSGG
jgi:soluble lytic murein transglycosylase-like protein